MSSSSNKRKGAEPKGPPKKRPTLAGSTPDRKRVPETVDEKLAKETFFEAEVKRIPQRNGDCYYGYPLLEMYTPAGPVSGSNTVEFPEPDASAEDWDQLQLEFRVPNEDGAGSAKYVYFPLFSQVLSEEEYSELSECERVRCVWEEQPRRWHYCPRWETSETLGSKRHVDVFMANMIGTKAFVGKTYPNCRFVLNDGWVEGDPIHRRCICISIKKLQKGDGWFLDTVYMLGQGPEPESESDSGSDEGFEEVLPMSTRSSKPKVSADTSTQGEYEQRLLSVTESNCMHSSEMESKVRLMEVELTSILQCLYSLHDDFRKLYKMFLEEREQRAEIADEVGQMRRFMFNFLVKQETTVNLLKELVTQGRPPSVSSPEAGSDKGSEEKVPEVPSSAPEKVATP